MINVFLYSCKGRNHSNLDPYFQFGGEVFSENRSAPVLHYMPPRDDVHVSGSTAPISFNFSVRKSVVCELHTQLTLPPFKQPSLHNGYDFNPYRTNVENRVSS